MEDSNLVMACQASHESEIRHILAENEEEKLFVDPAKGMWFCGITKSKNGHITINRNLTKDSVEHSSHLDRIINTPPKKHPITPFMKWGGGGIHPPTHGHTTITTFSPMPPALRPQPNNQLMTSHSQNPLMSDLYRYEQLLTNSKNIAFDLMPALAL
jgi:hypothetical protein